jgi:hypothetical protein
MGQCRSTYPLGAPTRKPLTSERPTVDGRAMSAVGHAAASTRIGSELHPPRIIYDKPQMISVDRIDRRVWYVVAAVVIVLLLAWLLGWFGGAETPASAPTTPQ